MCVFNIFIVNRLHAQNKKITLDIDALSTVNDSILYENGYTISIKNNIRKNALFKQDVSFYNSTFKNTARFSNSAFQKKAFFNNVTFTDSTAFYNVQFFKVAYFHYSEFNRSINFTNAEFKDTVRFDHSVFNTDADFSEVKFNKRAYYNNVVFKNDVKFSSTQFSKSAFFQFTKFNGNCDFNGTQFGTLLDLSNLQPSDSTSFTFSFAKLPQLINFSRNPNLHHNVDFTQAALESSRANIDVTRKWHYINLYNTDISKIRIDYQHFRLCFYTNKEFNDEYFPMSFTSSGDTLIYVKDGHKNLYFVRKNPSLCKTLLGLKDMQVYLKQIFPSCMLTDDVVTNFLTTQLNEGWFPKPLPEDEVMATYEKVLKNFEANGQKKSYQTLDIEFNDYKNGAFILPHIWNCYGYHREWVFYWALAFLVFFTLITFVFIDILNQPADEGGIYHLDNLKTENLADTWYNRLWYAFMYTSTLFFILKINIEKLNFKRKWGVFYIIIVYSIGVLCLGYMANFVLQK